MSILPITKTPDPILRAVAKPAGNIDRKIIKLIRDMSDTLNSQTDPQGVGLAAPQVGVSLRIFLIKPTQKSEITVFINPKIINKPIAILDKYPKRKTKLLEGCLSIPNIYSDIQRSPSLKVEFTTMDTKDTRTFSLSKSFSGFPAQIIQHELDHLEGKLFVDHALTQHQKLLRLKDNQWEEVNLGNL